MSKTNFVQKGNGQLNGSTPQIPILKKLPTPPPVDLQRQNVIDGVMTVDPSMLSLLKGVIDAINEDPTLQNDGYIPEGIRPTVDNAPPSEAAEYRMRFFSINRHDVIRVQAHTLDDEMENEPWLLFYSSMRMLNPQSYGSRLERRFIREFGWEGVSSRIGRGDAVDPATGEHYEIKTTLITRSNNRANFVQLRSHQDIAGYHCFIIEEDARIHHLYLTKEQMIAEEAAAGGQSAHGTQNAIANNDTTEGVIRVPWTQDSPERERWINTYAKQAPRLPADHPFAANIVPPPRTPRARTSAA